MSERRPDEPETYSEDIADLALTPDQEREAETNLDDPTDVDDVPWSPPEQRPLASELAEEDSPEGETIDQRIRQEERDTGAEDPGRA